MARFNAQQHVGAVVAEAPRTSRVFERHGIDYCCGGKVPLEKACAARGVDPQKLLSELEAAVETATTDESFVDQPASAVIEHILSTHHAFVKRELPRLSGLMEKVNRVHGAAHAETIPSMARTWSRLAFELEQHLAKEEEILFPMIRALEQGLGAPVHCGGVGAPIRVMEWEHDQHGEAFAHLRRLANGYVVPPEACGSWRALWSGLDEFEKDLHRHVHLENHVLFPKARTLSEDGD